jgi:hypothetical protein
MPGQDWTEENSGLGFAGSAVIESKMLRSLAQNIDGIA